MNKTLSLMSSISLLALGLAALALVPSASAHDCYSLVPGQNGCGACLPTSEDHDHRTVGNVTWCSSEAPDPPQCGNVADVDFAKVSVAYGGIANIAAFKDLGRLCDSHIAVTAFEVNTLDSVATA